MSRTYVHAPDRVKQLDPRWRRFYVEDHNHRHGRCDLHLYDPRALWSATGCHITWVEGGRNIYCGCRLCTAHHEFRAERRRDRHDARRRLREDRKAARGAGEARG